MKITAISQIIDWDAERGRSIILNPGETGEIGDVLGQQKVDAGEAEEVDDGILGQVHGDDGRPMDIPAGDINDGPRPLNISDDERASLPQLDHDGNGEPGGSVAATGDDVPALRARYKEVLGKAPFPGWDAKELARRIDVATDSFADEII